MCRPCRGFTRRWAAAPWMTPRATDRSPLRGCSTRSAYRRPQICCPARDCKTASDALPIGLEQLIADDVPGRLEALVAQVHLAGLNRLIRRDLQQLSHNLAGLDGLEPAPIAGIHDGHDQTPRHRPNDAPIPAGMVSETRLSR